MRCLYGHSGISNLLGLLRRQSRPQQRIVMDLHLNRSRNFFDHIGRFLFLLAKKGIQKFRLPHILPQFAMLEEDVHRLPKRVVEDLDEFLVDKRILRGRLKRIRAFGAR